MKLQAPCHWTYFCLCNSGKSVWTWTGRISICSSHFGSWLWLLVSVQDQWCWLTSTICNACCVHRNVLLSLQLQSNLIPGLNLNALGLFPSGAPGMCPSMSSVPPPGAHGGCSSFGVSYSPYHKIQCFAMNPPITYPGLAVCCCFFFILDLISSNTWGRLLEYISFKQILAFSDSVSCFFFSFSAVLMGLRGHFGLLCCRRAASPLL